MKSAKDKLSKRLKSVYNANVEFLAEHPLVTGPVIPLLVQLEDKIKAKSKRKINRVNA